MSAVPRGDSQKKIKFLTEHNSLSKKNNAKLI